MIVKTNRNCDNCSTQLLKDRTVGGDYVKGILHSYCPECGWLHGPYSDTSPLSNNRKKKIMVRVAMRYELDFFECCEFAKESSSDSHKNFLLEINAFLESFSFKLSDNDIKEVFII